MNEETGPPTEEELRAAYEEEMRQIRVEQILLEQVITLINLGMRRTGLAPGTEEERDVDQVRLAIEGVRALLPLVEPLAGPQISKLRDALSQMQLAYVRIGGSAPAATGGQGAAHPSESAAERAGAAGAGAGPVGPDGPRRPGQGEDAGPAQRSGRLWIPGQ